MGRKPCCGKGVIRGAWSGEEDKILVNYIKIYGEGKWTDLPRRAGLKRCGKSCRLRWLNYLRPDIKRGNITEDEDDLIIRLHKLLGNRWTLIAGRLPGRTDNEIKNYWNTNLSKRVLCHNNTSKTSQKLIKATQNQQIHRQTKHKVISPKAVRFRESKLFPALHHYLNINSAEHDPKSSNFPTEFDVGDFLSPHQREEVSSDFNMTRDGNFPSLAVETSNSTVEPTETKCSDVGEALQESEWNFEAIASFLCSEDVIIA